MSSLIVNSPDPQKKSSWFIIGGLILSLIIFLVDLQTPLGIADGVSYVAVVLLTIWVPGRRYVYYSTILGIGLTVAGYFLSPPLEHHLVVIPNRVLAVLAITTTGIMILRFKRTQELVLKTKEQLEALFLNANEGIFIIDARDKIVLSNPKSALLFDYSGKGLNDRLVSELIPGFTAAFAESKKPVAQGDFEDNKKILTGYKNKKVEFPIEVSTGYYKTEEGNFTVVFVTDITRRKKQETELLNAHNDLKLVAEELKRSNAELENFAYISSHDLQEPLRKIQSFGYRLNELESKNLGEQSKDYLDRMLNASSRMQTLINDLLHFSRVTGKSLPFTPVSLQKIFNEVVSDMEVAIEESHAKITSELSDVIIDGDPSQLRQLFQNLLANAIKFRKDGVPPEIRVYAERITYPAAAHHRFVSISFADNGIGFDEKYSDRIFNIFQRLEGKKYPGSGIGLTICRKIAHRHGGTINVKSRPGEGAVFTITLPEREIKIPAEAEAITTTS